MINHGGLNNCPISSLDFKRALDIWGADLGVLKGKTVRSTPTHVEDVYPLPDGHIDPVTLCMDLFFIDGLVFLLSISRKLNLLVVRYLPDRKIATLTKAIDETLSIYSKIHYPVRTILCDGEGSVAALKTYIESKGYALDLAAKGEHIPEIERSGRVLKERVRSFATVFPYKPTITIIVYLVLFCVYWINSFPRSSSTDKGIPPRQKVTGRRPDYDRDCKVEFGEYCQVHEDNEVTNNMAERTADAICLGPVGNLQNSYYFLNINTWKVIRRRSFTRLPMPSTVIDRINRQCEAEKIEIQLAKARFAFENGELFDDLTEIRSIMSNSDDNPMIFEPNSSLPTENDQTEVIHHDLVGRGVSRLTNKTTTIKRLKPLVILFQLKIMILFKILSFQIKGNTIRLEKRKRKQLMKKF